MYMGDQVYLPFVSDSKERIRLGDRWYPLAKEALATIQNQWSENTKIAYQYGFSSWRDWAVEHEEPVTMPPRPEAVVSWLQWEADVAKYSRSTIMLHLAGLSWADQWARKRPGIDVPLLQHHPLIRAWKRGFRRKSRAVVRDAMPPTMDELRRLISACYAPSTTRKGPARTPFLASRDRAFILLSYFGAMRKSEICALKVGDVHVSSRGIDITFGRTKSNQDGIPETRAIYPQDELLMCPVHAWNEC